MDELSASPLIGAAIGGGAIPTDQPLALFLDVDGTLLDLADRPGEVVTPAGLTDTLTKVERRLDGALALISGRPVVDLDRLFEPLRLRASGVHGAEMRLDPGAPTTAVQAAAELPVSLRAAVARAVERFPGAFVEDKRFSLAVHYRLAPEAEGPLREAVSRFVGPEAEPAIEIMDAHCAIELKVPGSSKGSAIATFLATPAFRGRTPIFIGDDRTDEAGFAVVAARGGFAYSVGPRRPGAIGAFDEPRDVRAWLAEFAAREAAA